MQCPVCGRRVGAGDECALTICPFELDTKAGRVVLASTRLRMK